MFLLNYHVKYSFRRIKNISWRDIYLPKKKDLWCALLTDYTNISL